MSLKKYQARRRFEKTPEPKGMVLKTSQNRFVIHKHQARHLHYDFRLEMSASPTSQDVVLKSWAVPKGLPEKIGVKRLAIQVENHPIEYYSFQGTIPVGQYGAGKVEIFDKGKYKLIERDINRISFELKGKKIKGPYTLIRMRHTKNWLIIKNK